MKGNIVSTKRAGNKRSERGDALVIALIAAMLMTLIPAGLVAAAAGQINQTQANQNSQGALAAAEAGVTNYQNLLNQYSVNQLGNYWLYSATNLPPVTNLALTGWEPVSGSTTEYFHYSVNNSTSASTGLVTLDATGMSLHGNLTQYETVRASFRSESFLDYLIFVNRMIADPVFSNHLTQLPVNKAESQCNFSFSQPNGSGTVPSTGPTLPACQGLINYYVTGQTFNGPIFSNDIYYLSGSPVFNGPVYSASPVTSGSSVNPYWIDPLNAYLGQSVSDNPIFNSGGNVQYHTPLNLPSADQNLEQIAAADGCLYYGPTQITLQGSTMTVVSPQTKNTACVGSNLPLPPNGVIYVASLPQTTSGTCNTQELDTVNQSAPCQQGNAFVQGTLSGQLTIASANDITVTGNLEYTGCMANGTSDLLGLIANNFVQVSDQFSKSNQTPDACFGHPSNDPTIMAAILTLQHSFTVQRFWQIPYSGTLYLYGALAGYYADVEGVFSGSTITNGYSTNYTYDNRLKYLSPPYFLSPIGASWLRLSQIQVDNPTSLPPPPS